jgi:hypothetical protein
MKTNLLFGAGAAVVVSLIAGCAADDGRAIKMQGQSGRMGRNNDYSYYAICKDTSPTTHTNLYKGPLWRERERAMQDAYDHNKANPGHAATVKSN